MTVVRLSRPYGTHTIGSHFEPQDHVLGYVQTVPTARREAADTVTHAPAHEIRLHKQLELAVGWGRCVREPGW